MNESEKRNETIKLQKLKIKNYVEVKGWMNTPQCRLTTNVRDVS